MSACERAALFLVRASAALGESPAPSSDAKAAALLLCSRAMLLIAESDPQQRAYSIARGVAVSVAEAKSSEAQPCP